MVKNKKIYQMAIAYTESLPYSKALGLTFERSEGVHQIFSVDWQKKLAGNNQDDVLHGGVMTALIDVAGGVAVAAHLEEFESVVTLDLRIDYLKSAAVGAKVYAQAECYRLAGQVAFVRTTCYQDDINDPIAFSMASYMRTPLKQEIKDTLV